MDEVTKALVAKAPDVREAFAYVLTEYELEHVIFIPKGVRERILDDLMEALKQKAETS